MIMKKSKNINFLYNLIYEVIAILSPLIVTPYVSRVLGVELVGVRSYTFSIVSYFELFISLGISICGQKEIAKCGDDVDLRSRIFFSLVSIKLLLFFVVVSIYCTVFFGFNISSEYKIVYLIWLIHIAESLLNITWFFQGIEEFKYISIRGVIFRILQIIITILLVKEKDDFYIYLIIYASIPLIQAISLWMFIPKFINFKQINKQSYKKHIKNILIFFVPTIATTLYSSIDKTMLGLFLDTKTQVGYYETAQNIVVIATTIFSSLYNVMRTRICYELYNQVEKVNKSIDCFIHICMLMVIPVSIGIFCVSKNFVICFFGNEYEQSANLLRMFSIVIFMIGISSFISAIYIVPYNKQKYLNIFYAVALLLNVAINFILIPKFEATGAVIGTIVSEMIVFIGCIFICRKSIALLDFFKYGWKNIIGGAIMFLIVSIMTYFMKIGYLSLIIEILTGIIVYVVCLIIFRDEIIFDILKAIFKRRCKDEEFD